ncbi:protein DYAD isoform X1 [Helianthus annuus]|uniref:protein DYAD isoform X1 n=2 Tax=Helianthus annuus TaxID=4232 RepID=UPI000B8F6162|nr:protein DYAD isoform X1 [Helianthus annuus]
METYHRKRSKRSAITANNEIMSLKRQETNSVLDGAQRQSPPLARQLLLDADYEVPDEEIELGSVYEIYHKNLPLRTPCQLRSTRVVMVSEKTDLNVAIRYPSMLSLRTYFSNGITEMYPALDEKFVMGTKLARKVLLRQVPSQEFAEKKHLEGFWLVKTNSQLGSHLGLKIEDIGVARELKNNMIRWGVRRQVMFIGRPKESSNTQSSSSFVQGEEEVKTEQQNSKDECQEDEEVEDQEENDDGPEDDSLECTRILRKRKGKQVKHLWQTNKKPMKRCRKLVIRDPSDRWSKERYKAAELSLLEAMKEKKAMIGNPITRPALRVEARKRIGDTGLLDHLLKHVANKVAPCGTLRFRRSHNADGAMEYWLESADLLKIRKDAGVKDPFWIPPPGWKPGDSLVQDPIVAKEIRNLQEVISNIKRDYEEELGKLKREVQELSLKKDESQAIVVSEQVDPVSKQLTEIFNYMFDSKSETSEAHKDKCSKVTSDFLKNLQAWMLAEVGKQTTQMNTHSTELITTTVSDAQKESEKLKAVATLAKDAGTESGRKAEGKAAKIERLKSGFKLFKPQGTFLWPNMVNPSSTTTSSMSSRVEDLLVVPTPPSVNSSTPPHHHHHHHHLTLVPPLKPVPYRRPLTVTLSEPHPSTTINLNDVPTNPSSHRTLNY